jgi:hypothetical protein
MMRILAALFPQNEQMWVLKLTGPADQLRKHEEAFQSFVRSVRFTGKSDSPITWTAPAGWQRGKEAAFSYATFLIGSGKQRLQVTLTPVSGSGAGAILDNVNRWRGQLGLAPLGPDQLSDVTKNVIVSGVTATIVDISGAGGDATDRNS